MSKDTGYSIVKKRVNLDALSTNLLFLAPAVFLMLVFIGYPIFYTLYLSLFDWNGIDPVKPFVGLENWGGLIHDSVFWKAFLNNLQIVVLSIAIQLPLGFLIAVFLGEIKRLSKFLKNVSFLPMLMSSVAIGILFKHILDPNFGALAAVSEFLGQRPFDILGSEAWALFAVILIISWQYTPFYMVFFLASITTVSDDIREYAQIDGATKFQYYTRIVVPMLANYIRTGAVLSLIGSLKYFDLIYVLTNGGPVNSTELMATYMYKNAFTSFRMGYGSTIAIALFLIVVIISSLAYTLPKLLSRQRGESHE
jgi:raffinose/stachyose/melibiose transport system permease protein